MKITIEMLDAQKKELQKELERIQKELKLTEDMIAVRSGKSVDLTIESVSPKVEPNSFSIRGRVVDATIDLIHKVGRQVGNSEILDHLEKRGISLGDTKNKQTSLAAILSQECDKKSARLKRVSRGIYDIK